MRLGALILLVASLRAGGPEITGPQVSRTLPWERVPRLPWQPLDRLPQVEPVLLQPSSGPLRVRLQADGTLWLIEGKGLRRLLTGLPGRPIRVWRDGGIPLPTATGEWTFPEDSPLTLGLGGLAWESEDLRPSLRGLLWILEDGESHLTVLHPATGRLAYLPLPPGESHDLTFGRDRLLVATGGRPPAWSLPWVAMLPTFIHLGSREKLPPRGGALTPF
ncbi:MAG TPA: hypothetical protein VJ623_07575 [Holophagaceae bacterium]|nr:hypothetical protein [Holophagaceae bacterium]